MSGITESYRGAKRRAAAAALVHPTFGYVSNPHVLRLAAEVGGGRDEMFSVSMRAGRLSATIEIGHDYEAVPAAGHDDEGRTLQACRLTVKVSWRSLERASPLVALEHAQFQDRVVAMALELERSFGESGVVWDVTMPAPDTRSAREEAA